MGGLQFGIASLYPVFYREQVFADICGDSAARQCTLRSEPVEATTKCCNAQQLRFTSISAFSIFTSDFGMVLFGELSDWLGPRSAFGVGALFVSIGTLMLGVGSSVNLHWQPGSGVATATSTALDEVLITLGLFCLGAGGPGVFVGALALSERYPSLRATVTSLVAAMEDSSALVFLLFNVIYFEAGVELEYIFFAWLCLCVLLGCGTLSSLPSKQHIDGVRDEATDNADALSRASELKEVYGSESASAAIVPVDSIEADLADALRTSGVANPEVALRCSPPVVLTHGLTHSYNGGPSSIAVSASLPQSSSANDCLAILRQTTSDSEWRDDASVTSSKSMVPHRISAPLVNAPNFRNQFCRLDTALILAFMSLHNLKATFFITTFADHMNELFDAETAASLAQTFNVAFPVSGFFTAFVAAVVLEKLGSREDLYMAVSVVLVLLFHLASIPPWPSSQLAAVLLFGPARTFQWACYFHVLYQHRRYSPKFAGRLVGYGNMVIAIIGNGPPSLLNFFVADATAVLDSVGNRYIAVHVGLLAVMTLACVALPFHLHRTR